MEYYVCSILPSFISFSFNLLLFVVNRASGQRWINLNSRKLIFETIANTKGFDSLIPENWYSISHDEVVREKVHTSLYCLFIFLIFFIFFIFLYLLYLIISLREGVYCWSTMAVRWLKPFWRSTPTLALTEINF